MVEVAELVGAHAEREPELVDEELLLQVGAELVAVLAAGRHRDVELVAPVVAPVAQDVLARRARSSRRPRGRRSGSRSRARPAASVAGSVCSRFGAFASTRLREGPDPQRPLGVDGPAVGHVRAALDVEGPDAGVDDALGAGVARLVGEPSAVAQILVDAQVDLRLAGAGVLEAAGAVPVRRVPGAADREAAGQRVALASRHGFDAERMTGERDLPDGARVGIRAEVAGREPVGPGGSPTVPEYEKLPPYW